MIPEANLIRSELRTSRLGFGCSRLHYLANSEARQALLESAFDLGIRHFDVAPSYGHGINERELGHFLRRHRENCTIATKFGMQVSPVVDRMAELSISLARTALAGRSLVRRFASWDERLREITPALLESAVLSSLQRLRLEHIDIHFLHEPAPGPDSVSKIRAILPTYRRMQKSGLIGSIGLSGSYAHSRSIWQELNEPDLLLQVPEAEWTQDFPPDISYGVIARHGQSYYRQKRAETYCAERRLEQALARRPKGVVLVSTTSHEHLRRLARAAERLGHAL